jgi:hypothetical protein
MWQRGNEWFTKHKQQLVFTGTSVGLSPGGRMFEPNLCQVFFEVFLLWSRNWKELKIFEHFLVTNWSLAQMVTSSCFWIWIGLGGARFKPCTGHILVNFFPPILHVHRPHFSDFFLQSYVRLGADVDRNTPPRTW